MNQEPGRCRFCGCTEDDACRLDDGDTCAWLTARRDVCTNPLCIKAIDALIARSRFEQKQKTRKRTPAEIHDLIRRRKRNRKGRAA